MSTVSCFVRRNVFVRRSVLRYAVLMSTFVRRSVLRYAVLFCNLHEFASGTLTFICGIAGRYAEQKTMPNKDAQDTIPNKDARDAMPIKDQKNNAMTSK